MLSVNSFVYPIICFSDKVFRIYTSATELCTSSPASALTEGWFTNMIVIDSAGNNYRVLHATKVGNAGWLWVGPLPIRKIKVELDVKHVAADVSVDDVRQRMYNATIRWHGLESRTDFDELKAAIDKAQTVAELIRIVAA